jgi:hypothetical protein
MTTPDRIRPEDVLAVQSRISWSAIFAGATVAMAVYILLGALGTALGFTMAQRVSDNELKVSAALWAVVSVLVSLFLGGYIATQCTAGENKSEAVIYGLTVWGVLFVALLWLTATGISFGFNGLIGAINSPSVPSLSAEDLRAAGVSQEQVDKLREKLQSFPSEVRQVAQSPFVAQAAWWSVGGIFLSMLAAVGGALAGSGPTFILRRISLTRVRAANPAPGQVVTR